MFYIAFNRGFLEKDYTDDRPVFTPNPRKAHNFTTWEEADIAAKRATAHRICAPYYAILTDVVPEK
jgi:hypothetical protein